MESKAGSTLHGVNLIGYLHFDLDLLILFNKEWRRAKFHKRGKGYYLPLTIEHWPLTNNTNSILFNHIMHKHFIICNQNRTISPTLKSKTLSEHPFSPTLTWTDGLYAQARARASNPNNSLRQLSTTIELELYFENM